MRQICVLLLTTGTKFLSSSSNYLRQLPQNGNLIVPTSCHCVSEDDKSSRYKGSCWYFRHHVCCICCLQQLDSNLFTLIFDISMFNTGLPWLVKSGEKAIIWGREKLTGKSLRSHEGCCHSIPEIWNRYQKRLLLTDIDFANLGKNTIYWKRWVKGNGKHITFKKKMKEMWKSGSHFQVSGMWQSCNGLLFGIIMSDQVLDPKSLC